MAESEEPRRLQSQVHESRRERIARLWDRMRSQRGLWTWGDDNGLIPWIDSHGHDVVALWSDAEAAERESRADADPSERALFISCESMITAIPKWLAAGLPEAGLDSESGRFLYTIPLEELADRARVTVEDPAGS
jgi:hypothetical protein